MNEHENTFLSKICKHSKLKGASYCYEGVLPWYLNFFLLIYRSKGSEIICLPGQYESKEHSCEDVPPGILQISNLSFIV